MPHRIAILFMPSEIEGVTDGRHELVSGYQFDELRVLLCLVEEVVRLGFHEHYGEREGCEDVGDELRGLNEIGERFKSHSNILNSKDEIELIRHEISLDQKRIDVLGKRIPIKK